MIYNFYVFGRGRKLLCREEWNRTRACPDMAKEAKFISGMLITLKSFTQQMGPPRTQGVFPRTSGFFSYTTPEYKLHSYETLSGYSFVITTDPTVPDQQAQDCLRVIYAELFVEHVVKHPLYVFGEEVSKCTAFLLKLRTYLQTRPFFATLPA
eukprot:gnl/TRDRNA2_/TRDRNA2_188383_c0_seq1.p1 gnl/TRDRNA2_/TRDRNA2_188383_c0~~gnl/TRDRNA2_/TRDRNA2_188383_c0_seq1.p1  ORF type:complete len:153 (+),score=30.39 gnl/TRDRNA2_/TRDRNA2_188383_c0_seq1:112-570(+)